MQSSYSNIPRKNSKKQKRIFKKYTQTKEKTFKKKSLLTSLKSQLGNTEIETERVSSKIKLLMSQKHKIEQTRDRKEISKTVTLGTKKFCNNFWSPNKVRTFKFKNCTITRLELFNVNILGGGKGQDFVEVSKNFKNTVLPPNLQEQQNSSQNSDLSKINIWYVKNLSFEQQKSLLALGKRLKNQYSQLETLEEQKNEFQHKIKKEEARLSKLEDKSQKFKLQYQDLKNTEETY